ncbi:MAG: CHASE4 domain-containing protein [Candidatus Gracilibacteria bacterium]
MKLRTRILVSLGAILVVMLAAMFLTIVNFVFEETKAIERNAMAGNIDRVLGALERDQDSLLTSVGDYASWDDTYQFAQDNNQEYIDANFGSSSFINLHVNLVAVLNDRRELIYARHVDWRKGEGLAVPTNLQDLFQYHEDLFEMENPKDKYTDIVRLNGELMFLAARPIVTSEYQGPIRGTLVMMRHLDENYIQDLSSLTQLNLSLLEGYSSDKLDSIFAPGKVLAPNTQRVINFIDDERMEAFFTLKNDEGNAEGVIRINRERTVNALAIDSLKNSMIFFFIFAAILIFGSLGIVDRYILRRLSRLSNAVFHYGTDRSQLSRCISGGKDELASLAKSVQTAFHELDLSKKKIKDHADRSDLEKRKLKAVLHALEKEYSL